jgi:hypothetical protein
LRDFKKFVEILKLGEFARNLKDLEQVFLKARDDLRAI